ncbi:hypothetical protein [Geodermatophilus ruber]|uniref:Uncharacterized protein n=1 Tax=Geodermatophilus ruber TaxID=504800 RepID=A0A1I3Z817_9ACTN|nr:hypothetical protein [Geodermatophilus ruber]SFK39766.1 hypothetical protein SAMN04488085_101389 [Geodermatophilus ruber]
MEDTQRDYRVAADTTTEGRGDETEAPEASAVPLARLLANPRRVRRD